MIKSINFFFELLNENKLKISILLLSFLFLALIEVFSLGLFSIYLKLVFDFENEINLFNLNLSKKDFVVIGGFIGVSVFIIKNIIAALVNFKLTSYVNYKGANMRVSYANMFMNMPYLDFINYSSSDIFNRINLYSSQFYLIINSVFKLATDLMIMFFVVIFLATIDFSSLSMLFLVFILFIFFYLKFFVRELDKFGELRNNSTRNLNQGIYEFSFSYRESKLYGVINYFLNKIKDNSYLIGFAQIRQELVSQSVKYFLEVGFIIFLVLVLTIKFAQEKDITLIISELSIFMIFGIRLIPITNSAITNYSQIKFVGHALNEISKDYSYYSDFFIKNKMFKDHLSIFKDNHKFGSTEINKNINNPNNLETFQNFYFKDMSFKYPKSNFINLKNINFSVSKGQKIGIIGISGSGKSTLIQLLLGFLNPTSGSIFLNDKEIKNNKDQSDFNSKIAYLPQEISILNDTLKSNIAFGIDSDSINLSKIREVIKISKCNEFIDTLPNGIETIIGERGNQVSGGQRQRIAIARALYFNKEILIMDESTSNIDEKTEKEIIDELNLIDSNLTILIIAHKKSLLENCNHLYKIENCTLKKIK